MEIKKEVLNLIKDPLAKEKFIIDEISYEKEDNNLVLRVILDKDPYIDIDDCVKATKIINPILDQADIIKETYVLDVCSKEKGGHNNGC